MTIRITVLLKALFFGGMLLAHGVIAQNKDARVDSIAQDAPAMATATASQAKSHAVSEDKKSDPTAMEDILNLEVNSDDAR